MKRIIIIPLYLLASLALAAEQERTLCESGEVWHSIQVVYPQGWSLPCEVHFATPEENRVVWNARTAEGFCERKAREIVQRRKDAGWQCHTETLVDSPALTESSLISDLPPMR